MYADAVPEVPEKLEVLDSVCVGADAQEEHRRKFHENVSAFLFAVGYATHPHIAQRHDTHAIRNFHPEIPEIRGALTVRANPGRLRRLAP